MSFHFDTTEIFDSEFGPVVVRRNSRAKHVRLRMEYDGRLVVTLPRFASLRHAEKMIESSRASVRRWQKDHAAKNIVFNDGDKVGRSHKIRFINQPHAESKVQTKGLDIIVYHPDDLPKDNPVLQNLLRQSIRKALQKEARAYLPRRLKHLAETFGFRYERVRFGTQKGRWGSCSSKGTISLNVGLMMLEPELIDYVLVHELCHTRNMNHSPAFWTLVEKCLPDYKALRKALKANQPNI